MYVQHEVVIEGEVRENQIKINLPFLSDSELHMSNNLPSSAPQWNDMQQPAKH